MGAWDVGAFDNDDACDWAASLTTAGGGEVLREALAAVLATGDEYLESPPACNAVAAAEVIARWLGHWGVRNAYTEGADRWVESRKDRPSRALVDSAVAAIDRVLGDGSELRDLLDESDSRAAWHQAMGELRKRLVSPSDRSPAR